MGSKNESESVKDQNVTTIQEQTTENSNLKENVERASKKKCNFLRKLRLYTIKYTIIIVLLICCFKIYGCMRQINRAPTEKELTLATNVDKVLNFKETTKELEKHVKFLSDREIRRNFLHMDSLNECADYISSQFSENSYYTVSEQQFETDDKRLKGVIFRNIIAKTPYIKDAPYIVVGAHYDCCYDTPGADDNASAVAVLLATAKKIALLKNYKNLNYNIIFVAYTNEEPPFFTTPNMGSYVHAQSLKKANTNVELMICLEMLGYYSDEPNSQRYPVPLLNWLFPTKGNFVATIANSQSGRFAREMDWYIRKFAKMPSEFVALPNYVEEGGFSDHRNFWALKIPAIMLTDTANFRNKNYHQITDTYDTLNYKNMAKITDALTIFLLNYKVKDVKK